jgi:hypothetical protein
LPLNPKTGLLDSEKKFFKPGSEIIKKLKERSERTPDFPDLRMLKEIPVFLYGLEKRGMNYNYLLRGSYCYGTCHTMSDRFLMKETEAKTPVVFETTRDHKMKYKIRGEVFGCSVEHIHLLDRVYFNGERFKRCLRRVQFEAKGYEPKGLKQYRNHGYTLAFMYLGVSNYWKDNQTSNVENITYPVSGDFREIPMYEFEEPEDEWGFMGRMANQDYSYGRYGPHSHIG